MDRGPQHGPREYLPPDNLFSALDGRDVTVSGDRWHIEVYSVADVQSDRWVQLAVTGGSLFMITLKLSAAVNVGQVLSAVATWVRNPSAIGALLTIT